MRVCSTMALFLILRKYKRQSLQRLSYWRILSALRRKQPQPISNDHWSCIRYSKGSVVSMSNCLQLTCKSSLPLCPSVLEPNLYLRIKRSQRNNKRQWMSLRMLNRLIHSCESSTTSLWGESRWRDQQNSLVSDFRSRLVFFSVMQLKWCKRSLCSSLLSQDLSQFPDTFTSKSIKEEAPVKNP